MFAGFWAHPVYPKGPWTNVPNPPTGKKAEREAAEIHRMEAAKRAALRHRKEREMEEQAKVVPRSFAKIYLSWIVLGFLPQKKQLGIIQWFRFLVFCRKRGSSELKSRKG